MNSESNPTLCGICLETNCIKMTKLQCGHEFCSGCLDRWSQYKNTCPNCRENFHDTYTITEHRRDENYEQIKNTTDILTMWIGLIAIPLIIGFFIQ